MKRALMRNNKSSLPGLSKATVYVNWLTLRPQFHTHSVQDTLQTRTVTVAS